MKMSLNVNRNRRLRKKLYLHEFAIKGFELQFTFEALDEDAFYDLVDRMIDFADTRNLVIAGGATLKSFHGLITSADRYESATEEDLSEFNQWLAKQSSIDDISVGELVDANYDFDTKI
ncbi:YggL family protein [Pelagibaculum spongiae]|uniref:DUF469 domain-containing protein n=1 Tax=Pelagibaculum spongiae TaxID=2080658 RepID=A0A2V1GTC1_9GAMM|nr:50S ribosome-binding protein YggL [Pelagibaculum spongiae]PVZ68848.1 hypothetical protein DC094_11370 [Pelagibaculum spongiae]